MPGDLIWVAVISSGVGVGGALLGASLTSFVTYKVTKRQTDAQVEGLMGQLKHNADESRRARIVAARKVYLDPLRMLLVQWVSAFIELQAYWGQLPLVSRAGGTMLAELHGNIKASLAASKTASDKLNKHLGQISDSILMQLINQIWKDQLQTTGEIQKLAQQADDLAIRVASGSVRVEAAEEEAKGWSAAMEALVEQRQKQYLVINQRVEQLMAVDDAT